MTPNPEQARPLVVNWGFGMDFTGMIVAMLQRGLLPDLIISADTLGEKPETYAYIPIFRKFVMERHPEILMLTVTRGITKVRQGNRKVATDVVSYSSLEENCFVNKTLPSLAFGMKGCSQKWKREPIEWFEAIWPPAVKAWANGGKVIKAIGYDAGEPHRAAIQEDDKYSYIYPLIEWGIDRDGCASLITEAGLPLPPKSACYYCPAAKKPEIVQLSINHPNLYQRALQMEDNAAENLGSVKGLGRSFSWRDVKTTQQLELPTIPCMCFDGE